MTRDITNDASNPNKTALVLADKIPIIDTETNPNSLKESLISDLLKIVNVLTADTSPDGAADFLLTYDASAAAAKKVLLHNLLKVINGLTEDTTPDGAADFLVTYDASASAAKKVLPHSLLKVVNGLTEDTTPDVAADFLVTYDASATAAKKALPQNLFRATTFSPSWSGITVGNGTSNGRYIQIGKLVHFDANFVLGSTSAVTGSVTLTLPVTAASYAVATQIGISRLRDASGALSYTGAINNAGTISAFDSSATYATAVALSSTIPFTWATSDEISASGVYVAA